MLGVAFKGWWALGRGQQSAGTGIVSPDPTPEPTPGAARRNKADPAITADLRTSELGP